MLCHPEIRKLNDARGINKQICSLDVPAQQKKPWIIENLNEGRELQRGE